MLMLRRILTLHNLVFALATVASGQLAPQSPSVHRGDVETVKGSIPQGLSTIALRRPGGIPSSDIPLTIRTQAPAEFTFIVVSSKAGAPFNGVVPFARYDLVLKDAGDKELPEKLQTFIDVVPGDVHLNSVDSFDPYPQPPKDAKGQVVKDAKGKEEAGEYAIDLEGSGFSEIPDENVVVLDDEPLVKCSDPSKGDCAPNLEIDPSMGGRHISVIGIPLSYHGTHKVKIRVGGKDAPDEHPRDNDTTVTLSWVGEWVPAAIAIGGYLLVVLILYLLLSTGLRKLAAAQQLKSLVAMMFLEPETNSYSLSKLQFYLWTGAAVLGYVYLTAAKSLAQGDFAWGDIPAGLPAIILASAGTTVAVSGISAVKGAKGAGEVDPSLADFITTGGIVAPERVQFLVWTLVGVTSFLALVFMSSPISIRGLPPVPSGFLQLMGISAAGYIGGKLVRKAGPKVNTIDATIDVASGNLTLNIAGGCLSQSGSFEIDGKQIGITSIVNDQDPHRPKAGAKDPTANDPDLFQSLELPIQDPDNTWLTPDVDHNLTIYNPDGQKAVGTYQIAPVSTLHAAAVSPAPTGAAAHVLVVAPGFGVNDAFTYEQAVGGPVVVASKIQAGKPYLFDVVTGAPAGTNLKIRITKPGASGQTSISDSITV